MAKLTVRQQSFVDEYLIDPTNGTQAAIRAGYSPKVAAEVACENLTKSNIREAIDKAMAKRAKRTGITQDRVLNEIAKMAFVNMADLAEWTPDGVTLKHSEDLSIEDTACVAEVSETKNEWGTAVKIKLHDKKGNLELLGRHLNMFGDKLEVTIKGALAERMKRAREAAKNGKASDD
ncbi:MAG: terminase small subunit [Negativicutes bacterium]|nr:terminase small subunit [Negativicutes bacterium]